jgi:hypothetical protein
MSVCVFFGMRQTYQLISLLLIALPGMAQDFRWQQRVEYAMDVKLDVSTHRVTGEQHLTYYNNSPDTLTKVYYHLFFNAFQPGSMMDVRSRTISDPDPRVVDRISKLKDDEIGYQKVVRLNQDGKAATFQVHGTILEVTLPRPILPRTKTVLDMTFEAQVPVQIRRSGRNNREGVDYSMTQWYPRLCEYDFQGWHAYQYVAREFHGVWGDFDVKITLDPRYVVGGTGVLQNPQQIGHGYEKTGTRVNRPQGNLTWHFIARNVIDFAWAADPDYAHDRIQVNGGPEVHLFYLKKEKTIETWKKMQPIAAHVFQFLNERFGRYPFDTYSIIQGGDGGMEYPMCTLILGDGSLEGVSGTMAHEVAHSWYQMTLASNEALYPWMDEGYTSFASEEALANPSDKFPHQGAYDSYFALVNSGLQEPISQHSDHYSTNRAYGRSAYSMGEVFLEQLKYIIGEDAFYQGMKRYYNTWKMKHPEPNDFIRIMEKVSGMQLHWYMRYWVNTTKRIDYGIGQVTAQEGHTLIDLHRLGEFPMPVEVMVTFRGGRQEMYYVPTNETLGNKPAGGSVKRTDAVAWPWVNPSYTLKVNGSLAEIESLEIDPSQRMADINRKNNKFTVGTQKAFEDTTRK